MLTTLGIVASLVVALTALGRLWFVERRDSSSRREVNSAEAESLAVATAEKLLGMVRGTLAEQTHEIEILRGEVGDLRAAVRDRDDRARAHAGWDARVKRELADVGISVPAAPPLYPPA